MDFMLYWLSGSTKYGRRFAFAEFSPELPFQEEGCIMHEWEIQGKATYADN
jgi:hypothetical protein